MTSKRSDPELLELRRQVCEIIHPGKDIRIEVGNVWICDRAVDREGWISKRTAPALESDNGLALDALVQFCAERAYVSRLHINLIGDGGVRECAVEMSKRTASGFSGPSHWTRGETPALAIVKAIIAASAKGKEGKSDEAAT